MSPNLGGAVSARHQINTGSAPPNQNGPSTLEGFAAQAADTLLRCHSIVDRMEAAVFGPEPPSVAGGGSPVPSVGLANRLAEGVQSTATLSDRLQRLAERIGG